MALPECFPVMVSSAKQLPANLSVSTGASPFARIMSPYEATRRSPTDR